MRSTASSTLASSGTATTSHERHHDLSDDGLAEVEDPLDHLPLGFLDVGGAGRLHLEEEAGAFRPTQGSRIAVVKAEAETWAIGDHVDPATRICKDMCVYDIRFAAGVERDLRRLKPYDRRRILKAIEEQLPYQATTPSRQRKLLVNLVPPWTADPPIWELRVGDHRVFYDVAEEEIVVYVRAIRLKRAGKRTEDIL